MVCQAYVDFPNVDLFLITKYQNTAFGNVTISFIRNLFLSFGGAVKLMMADTDFLKVQVFLESLDFIIEDTCCQLSSWSDPLTLFTLKKKSAGSPGLNNHILSASCSVTAVLQFKQPQKRFSSKHHRASVCSPGAVWANLILLHRIWQIHILKD